MSDLDLAGKKVAVFGLGDQISYSENFADATGEVSCVRSKGTSITFLSTYDNILFLASRRVRKVRMQDVRVYFSRRI